MSSKITDLLKEAGQGVFTDDVLSSIEKVFNEAVEAKLTDQLQIAVEQALAKQDSEQADKLKKLLESIDNSHSNKLARAVRAFDQDRTAKLKKLVEHYDKQLTEMATVFSEDLIKSVSNYLDVAIEDAIPTETIREAAQNRRAMDLLQEFRRNLAVDSAVANPEFRDALRDGKRQIDEQRVQNQNLIKDNIKLRLSVSDAKKDAFLLGKTRGFDNDKARVLTEQMKNKDFEYVKENFDFAAKLYDKNESDFCQTLKEEAAKKAQTPAVIEENTKIQQEAKKVEKKPANKYVDDLDRAFN